jgi:hypothetical protein
MELTEAVKALLLHTARVLKGSDHRMFTPRAEYSCPLEHKRMYALNGLGSFVAKILVVERERPGRISVILVKEALGF